MKKIVGTSLCGGLCIALLALCGGNPPVLAASIVSVATQGLAGAGLVKVNVTQPVGRKISWSPQLDAILTNNSSPDNWNSAVAFFRRDTILKLNPKDSPDSQVNRAITKLYIDAMEDVYTIYFLNGTNADKDRAFALRDAIMDLAGPPSAIAPKSVAVMVNNVLPPPSTYVIADTPQGLKNFEKIVGHYKDPDPARTAALVKWNDQYQRSLQRSMDKRLPKDQASWYWHAFEEIALFYFTPDPNTQANKMAGDLIALSSYHYVDVDPKKMTSASVNSYKRDVQAMKTARMARDQLKKDIVSSHPTPPNLGNILKFWDSVYLP